MATNASHNADPLDSLTRVSAVSSCRFTFHIVSLSTENYSRAVVRIKLILLRDGVVRLRPRNIIRGLELRHFLQ